MSIPLAVILVIFSPVSGLKFGSVVAEDTRRHCSQNRRPPFMLSTPFSAASAIALEGGTYTFDACNSVRAKELSLVRVHRQPASSFSCAQFTGSCAWTLKHSCPGQSLGSAGEATDDGNVGYHCCCGAELWKREAGANASFAPAALTDDTSGNRTEESGENPNRQVVWVSGYPRSGTSTMLSMVSAAGGHVDAREPGHTFSLFEPCHNGDELSPSLELTGCMGLLGSISNCQFSDVQNLWGWSDPHSTNNRSAYSSDDATRICMESDVIAFKTVDFAHDLKRYVSFLDSEPRLKILDIVRDPRGIWGSWKSTEPFSSLLQKGTFYTLLEICENFASNLELNHSRVHHVVFEDLVANPVQVTTKIYEFLSLPFEEPQLAWVDRTFDAKECPPPPPGIPKEFTDCHKDSAAKAEKWRTILSKEELDSFNASPACQKVVSAYGFPA